MNNDFITSLVILGVSALILHLKSHVKFITLGLFVGIVLAEAVAAPIYQALAPRWEWLARPSALNSLQLLLLLLPTFILGINHTVDRTRKLGLLKTVAYTVVTTLLLLASTIKFLPENLQQSLVSRSTIAWQLLNWQRWLLLLGAIVVVSDSFRHKRQLKLDKAKKSK